MSEQDSSVRSAILLVDDDEALLAAMTRLLRPDGMQVLTAASGEQALELLEGKADTIGAIISDYAMPGISGADLLRMVRMRWPDLTRVLATGNADLAAASRAVNEGQVSRLITKPWNPEQFRELASEVLEQHRALLDNRRLRVLADEQSSRLERQAERLEEWNRRLEEEVAARTAELQAANANLQRGLFDTVRLLVGFLERRVPQRVARSREIARMAGRLADRAGMPAAEVQRVQLAALVRDVGLLALPEAMSRTPPENLPPAGLLQYKQHPTIAFDMLSSVEQLGDIATWVRAHHERWDGNGYPDRLVGAAIPTASQLISLADGYLEALDNEGGTGVKWRRRQIVAGALDPNLLAMLDRDLRGEPEVPGEVRTAIHNLKAGMRLDESIKTATGALVLNRGEILRTEHISRLVALASGGALQTTAVRIVSGPGAQG